METRLQLPAIPGFDVGDPVGAGPLFTVHRAVQMDSQRECCLQLVDLGMVAETDIGEAMTRAAAAASSLAHDNIAATWAWGVAERTFYLASEFAAGDDLGARIKASPGWRDALSLARSLADALAFAHQNGVIHGGLHPEVVRFDAQGQPRVSGFGVAAELTRRGVCGLGGCLAPEVVQGAAPDRASDMYALGVLMYKLLLGRQTFADGPPAAPGKPPKLPDVIGAAAPMIRSLVDANPDQRPADAQAVADALQRVVDAAGGATVSRGSTRVQPAPSDDATVVPTAADGGAVRGPRDATRQPSAEPTRMAPQDETRATGSDATQVTAGDATRATAGDATRATAGDAMRATAGDATRAAAGDATRAAAGDATRSAADDATQVAGADEGTVTAAGDRKAARHDRPTKRPPSGLPSPGDTIRGRFRIESVLGAGGMGKVYKALDLIKQEAGDDQPNVAMKVMRPEIASADLTFKALQREAKRAQQLAHPNIVTVYDLDRVDGMVYMTMELMRGEDSEQRVDKHPQGLEPDVARGLVNDVTAGLAYAHVRGITHADLKPQNVFIGEDGRAKLLDFGIARAHKATRPDEIEEMFSGYTPAYASPEILAGGKATPRGDVYALGCVAYYYFTGKHPFGKKSADKAKAEGLKVTRPKNMRRAEWRAVAQALDFDESKRPKDAAEFGKRFNPSKVKLVVGSVAVVAAAVALTLGLLLGGGKGPEVAFEDLPAQVQTSINKNIEDAKLFASVKQLNPAIQLYDTVLQTHPGDLRATDGMNAVVDKMLAQTHDNLAAGKLSQADARLVYKTLMDYKTLPSEARDKIKQAQARL